MNKDEAEKALHKFDSLANVDKEEKEDILVDFSSVLSESSNMLVFLENVRDEIKITLVFLSNQ